MTTQPTISIVTPWLGGRHLIPDYERAVRGAQVITVDNGSDAATAAALTAMSDRLGGIYLRNEHNAGFAGANNQGYAYATGDIVVFLNSDVGGSPDWLHHVAADVQHGGLYGPALAQQLAYGMWLPYLEGWCVAATRETWRLITLREACAVGPWDDIAYPRPYWEDNDLCLRAMQAGHTLNQTAWKIHHKGGQSAGSLIKWGADFEANRATFAARVRQVWEAKQAAPHPTIYDCFTFNDELDLLEARLELLGDHVDYFVLVEATQTFTGHAKPPHYALNQARFARWQDKIIPVTVDDMPETTDAWARETHQRNAIMRGLCHHDLKPGDVVLISDVDEIPDPATLPRAVEGCDVIALDQQFFYYSPRFRHQQTWRKALACRAALLERFRPQQLRDVLITSKTPDGATLTARVVTCGWHLSYFGDVAAIQRKLASFSHQEYNLPAFTNAAHLAACIAEGRDLFGRTGVHLDDLGDTADLPPVLQRLALVEVA